jgi:lipid-binding SYLF domain-containing protein
VDWLYSESSAAKELGAKASGILIFPSVSNTGIFGGGSGPGVLRVEAAVKGYYSIYTVGHWPKIGGRWRSIVIMFMTGEALKNFMDSHLWEAGVVWEAGVDADVTIIDKGATGSIDTTTLKDPVIGFNFGDKGLMPDGSIEGDKVIKQDPITLTFSPHFLFRRTLNFPQ